MPEQNQILASMIALRDATSSKEHLVYSSGDALYYDGAAFAPSTSTNQNTNQIMMLNMTLSSGAKSHRFFYPDNYQATTPPFIIYSVVGTTPNDNDIIPSHLSEISTSYFDLQFSHIIPNNHYSIRAMVFKNDSYVTFSGDSYNLNPIWTNKTLFADSQYGQAISGTRENPNFSFRDLQHLHNTSQSGDTVLVWPGSYSGFSIDKENLSFVFMPQAIISTPVCISGVTGSKFFNLDIQTNDYSGLVLITGNVTPTVSFYGYNNININTGSGYAIHGTGHVFVYEDLYYNRGVSPTIDITTRYTYKASQADLLSLQTQMNSVKSGFTGIITLDSANSIRNLSVTGTESGFMGFLRGHSKENDGGQGMFWLDKKAGMAANLDNSGTIFSATGDLAGNYYWKRFYKEPIDVALFGIIGDGDSSKASYNSATLNYLIQNFKNIEINQTGVYCFNDTLPLRTGMSLVGANRDNIQLKWVGSTGDIFILQERENTIGNFTIDLNSSASTIGIGTLRSDNGTTRPYRTILKPLSIVNVGPSGIGLDLYQKDYGFSHFHSDWMRVNGFQSGKFLNDGAVGISLKSSGGNAYITALDFKYIDLNYLNKGIEADNSGASLSAYSTSLVNIDYVHIENCLYAIHANKLGQFRVGGGDIEGNNANLYGQLAKAYTSNLCFQNSFDSRGINSVWVNGSNTSSGWGGFEFYQSVTQPLEFYCVDGYGRNPCLRNPSIVSKYNIYLNSGVLGTLGGDEWAWGDNDTLGYNTLYVRLSGETNPNSGTSSAANRIVIEYDDIVENSRDTREAERTVKWSQNNTDKIYGRTWYKGDIFGVTGYQYNIFRYFNHGGVGYQQKSVTSSGAVDITDYNQLRLSSSAAVTNLVGYKQQNHFIRVWGGGSGVRVLHSSNIDLKYDKDWIAKGTSDWLDLMWEDSYSHWFEINRSSARNVFGYLEHNGNIDGEGEIANLYRFKLGGVGRNINSISSAGQVSPNITTYNAIQCNVGMTITGFGGVPQDYHDLVICAKTPSTVIVSGSESNIVLKTGIWTSSYSGDCLHLVYNTHQWTQV